MTLKEQIRNSILDERPIREYLDKYLEKYPEKEVFDLIRESLKEYFYNLYLPERLRDDSIFYKVLEFSTSIGYMISPLDIDYRICTFYRVSNNLVC